MTPLDARKSYKPLDFGNGIVAGSLAPSGRLVSLGMANPKIGRLWLTATDPFPESSRGDEDAVRRHRAALAAPDRPSFGLSLLEGHAEAFFLEDSFPLAVHDREDARIEVTTIAPNGRTGAVQVIRVVARQSPLRLLPEWTGDPRLGRADYTQITEGGPIPHPPVAPRHGRDGPIRWIDDDALEAAVAILVPELLEVRANASGLLVLALAFGRDTDQAIAEVRSLARDASDVIDREVRSRRALWTGLGLEREAAHPVRRGVAYALDCAASRITERAIAIITDHVGPAVVQTDGDSAHVQQMNRLAAILKARLARE